MQLETTMSFVHHNTLVIYSYEEHSDGISHQYVLYVAVLKYTESYDINDHLHVCTHTLPFFHSLMNALMEKEI